MHLKLLKIGLLFSLFWLLQNANAQEHHYTNGEADSLFRQYRLAESHAAYLQVSRDDSPYTLARSLAYQQLAAQDIKFYHANGQSLQMLRYA